MSFPQPATIEVTADLRGVQFRGGPDNRYALGTIAGHDAKGRFVTGELIHTSTVLHILGDLLFTRNSVYRVLDNAKAGG